MLNRFRAHNARTIGGFDVMATKYGRGGFDKSASGGKLHTGPETGLSARRRLLMIYIGILMFCVLMLLFYGLGLQSSLALLPEEEGVGVVVKKETRNNAFMVTVEVDVLESDDPNAATTTLTDDVRVPEESYELVNVGDNLHVTYQVNEARTRIVIRDLRVVATEQSQPAAEVVPNG